jgi:hypothetical protein
MIKFLGENSSRFLSSVVLSPFNKLRTKILRWAKEGLKNKAKTKKGFKYKYNKFLQSNGESLYLSIILSI